MKQFMNLIVIISISGCSLESQNKAENDSSVKIINGKMTGQDEAIKKGTATGDYGAVIKFYGASESCTGTFIRHNLFLTAAHCVQGSNAEDVTILKSKAKKIITNKKYIHGSDDMEPYDLALIVFRNNLALNTIP